ncbi:hypothetical protein M413DRAFT_247830 [Hebeloma cylindrosporum]|uniref:Uncharacterized protein n=1 Tax=Hebeloma cylindrosporum TaxID=76867 RepID=A0A0C3BNH6_HEBCY|nr:hypothetical protein M413DRAFT_247830 [Hebeloma cylindrosporum h7]
MEGKTRPTRDYLTDGRLDVVGWMAKKEEKEEGLLGFGGAEFRVKSRRKRRKQKEKKRKTSTAASK